MTDLCRICGAEHGSALLTKRLGKFVSSWVLCQGCQSARIAPYPSEDKLAEYYNSDYLSMDAHDESSLGVSHKVRFSDAYKKSVFDEYSYSCMDVGLKVEDLSKNNSKVLDYGCANGVFLDWLSLNGCNDNNLFGYDIGVSMVDEALAKGFKCTTEIEKLQGEAFDLITLWDVIEHVPYPRNTLKNIRLLLSRGGGKVLVQTPNFGELAVLMGEAFAHYLVFEHLHLFSRKALIGLFESEGFVCLAQKSFGANALLGRVDEPYKTAYDKLAKTFDFGATQVLLFGLKE